MTVLAAAIENIDLWDLRQFLSVTADVPAERSHDLDFLIGMLDWDANINPEFATHNRVFPKPVRAVEEMEEEGYRENWVTYGTNLYSAKNSPSFPAAA